MKFIDDVIDISVKAGEAILEYYNDEMEVARKDDNSPLTKADLASHQVIAEGLKAVTPGIPVLSEEGGIADYETRKTWKQYWLVDPLDGTKEFIKKNGEFTVNIALIENNIPVFGVIYVPAQKITYKGSAEEGSFKREGDGAFTRIHSDPPDIANPLTVVASRSHGSDTLDDELKKREVTVGKKIPAGSSLKFCLVAEGVADIYPRMGPTMEWDTAAGDAIFRYSGRKEARFSPLQYNKPSLKNSGFMIGLK